MTEARRIYRVGSQSIDELNRVFASIADRMDELEGYRGKGDFKTIPSASQAPSATTDLARYGEVITYADTTAASAAAGIFGATIVTISANKLKVYDPDGVTLLHGFGDIV